MYEILKKYFWRKGNARFGNFTRVGCPVRIMTKTKSGWRFNAGQISCVHGNKVDVWVFPSTGEKPYLDTNVSNIDFKEKGYSYWDFVQKDYCHGEVIDNRGNY